MIKNNDELVMIFIKNPVKGKVKTRLAKTIGNEKALIVYNKLLKHTQEVTTLIAADKILFYSEFIDNTDNWSSDIFYKEVQMGNELGERMSNAFLLAFSKMYKKVIIIGSDCVDIADNHINQALNLLDKKDIVIGPAKDGGYYLLGMKCLHADLFINKKWSGSTVCKDMLNDILSLKLSFGMIEELSDIDEEQDLKGREYLLKN